METLMYKKRAGTSGISGHLYETKLISLLQFRLLHDDAVQQFHLASNVDDIGGFDDVCFRMQIAGCEHPLLVCVQAKHKDDPHTFLELDLIKQFYYSYVKVRQKILLARSHDVLFDNRSDDLQCVFILYTNAKWFADGNRVNSEQCSPFRQVRRPYQSKVADRLNYLLATGDEVTQGSQLGYTSKHLEFANDSILAEEIASLAKHFAAFINNKYQSMNILQDAFVAKYHVILAQKVVHVSDIQRDNTKPGQEWRLLTFRPDFLETEDKVLSLLRDKIYEIVGQTQVMKERNCRVKDEARSKHNTGEDDGLIATFLSKPSATSLSPLISTYIIYNKAELCFTVNRPNIDVQTLKRINLPIYTIYEAVKIKLSSLTLKIPKAFGNVDIVIGGGPAKVKKRLKTLAEVITRLCKASKTVDSHEVVTVDHNVGDGFLSLNGGLASAVGNLFVHDAATKLLKFTDDRVSLKQNARTLFDKLNESLVNLTMYRFNVNTLMTFPKLALDCSDEAEAFLNKVLVYDKQSSHITLDEELQREIERYNKSSPHNLPFRSDTMLVYYHNEVQKWWMSDTGAYLTKTNDIYEQAMNKIVVEPQMSKLHSTFLITYMKYFGYSFREDTQPLRSIEQRTYIIRTEVIALTTAKIVQFLKNKYEGNYAMLELECILSLPDDDFSSLSSELKKTDKVVIIACACVSDRIHSRTLHNRLNELTQALHHTTVITVTNNYFLNTFQEYFPFVSVCDDIQSFNDFTADSRKEISNNARVIFQGEEVRLDLFVDDVSATFIKGEVLNNIMCDKIITVGAPLTNTNYENIKHLCIDRRVYRCTGAVRLVTSFYDLEERVVLLIAKPGMGKSTLLTHLSIKTKQLDKKLWIVRINLLNHSEEIAKWPNDVSLIDVWESLQFICRVILNNSSVNISLEQVNGEVHVSQCATDERTSFELNMFLHFFNKGKVIFLFDGFDEICPNYKAKVIRLFELIKSYPQKIRMWVTSRPYVEILSSLERTLDKAYELRNFTVIQQQEYLFRSWAEKLPVDSLTEIQNNNIQKFLLWRTTKLLWTTDKLGQSAMYYTKFRRFLQSHMNKSKLNSNDTHKRVPETSKLRTVTHVNSTSSLLSTQLMETPLMLYLMSEYFVNILSQDVINLERNINIFTVYESFVDTQITSCSRDRSKMNLYVPNAIKTFDKERAKCLDMHKRLAAYVVFYNTLLNERIFVEFQDMVPFNENSIAERDAMLNEVKSGTENTGFISHIVYDEIQIPVFTHNTFRDYFAAEYISDLFKSVKYDKSAKELLLLAIYVTKIQILDWVYTKADVDEELNVIIKDINYQPITKSPMFSRCSEGFNMLIKNMMHDDNRTVRRDVRMMQSGIGFYI